MGQLRQNPTQMLREVAAGKTYTIIRYGQEIAQVTPPQDSNPYPPEVAEPTRTRAIKPLQLPEGLDVDSLLEEMRGEW